MSNLCIVLNCKNIGSYCIPSSSKRKAEWLKVIPLKPSLTLGKHSRICTAHFFPSDFTASAKLNPSPLILKKTAIPSIFKNVSTSRQPNTQDDTPSKNKSKEENSPTPEVLLKEQTSIKLEVDDTKDAPSRKRRRNSDGDDTSNVADTNKVAEKYMIEIEIEGIVKEECDIPIKEEPKSND